MKQIFLATLLICCTTVSPAQWESRKSNLPSFWGNGQAIDACGLNSAVVALSNKGLWQTTDTGLTWQSLGLPAEHGRAMDISMPDSAHVWVATDAGRILLWRAGSGIWEKQFDDTSVTPFMNFIRMFDTLNGIAMGDAKAQGLPAVFLRTTDGGAHWVSVNDSAFGSFSSDTWRRLDFVNPDVGYYQESGVVPQRIYKTLDGGVHWAAVAHPDTLFPEILKSYDGQVALVASHWRRSSTVGGFTVARSLDGGNSWKVYSNPDTTWGNDIEFMPGDPSKVWLADQSKLFFSADTGRTWQVQWPKGGRDIVFTDPLHGWILGDDTTLLYTSSAGVITDAKEAPSEIATNFALEQNYPNPFNPVTQINYTIGQSEDCGTISKGPLFGVGLSEGGRSVQIQLTVYDILGREVRTLVNERQAPGHYQVRFDGSGLASGTYFYRLRAGGFVQSRKILLLR